MIWYVQICFTPCLSIISWNISPPFIPTKLWSISGCRKGCNGCTSLSLEISSLRLNAGEGTGRCCDDAGAAWASRFAVSETFRFEGGCVCVCVCPLRYGETAAGAGVEEKRRARGRHWTARLAVLACSIVAAFMRRPNGSKRCRDEESREWWQRFLRRMQGVVN